jgi:hypothetical protein
MMAHRLLATMVVIKNQEPRIPTEAALGQN